MKKLFFLLTSITALYSCQKAQEEDPSLIVTPKSIVLYSEGTKQITTNAKSTTYSSQDEFYASVDENGLVSANRVGSTLIDVFGNRETQIIPITILPRYTLYPDLDQLIGKTKSDVTDKLGFSYTEKNDIMTYNNLTSYASVMVSLKNNKVDFALALVSTIYISQLVDYLSERYAIAGMQNDLYFFLNHDQSIVVGTEVYSANYLVVMYMVHSGSKATDDISFSIDRERFNQLNL